MALSPNHGTTTGRSFGEGVGRVAHYVQRGIQGVMAAKGAWDTARTLYGIGSAAAPYIAAALL